MAYSSSSSSKKSVFCKRDMMRLLFCVLTNVLSFVCILMYNKPPNTTTFVVFNSLLYINIPRLSHNGMENPRTTVKKNFVCIICVLSCYNKLLYLCWQLFNHYLNIQIRYCTL